MSDAMKDIVYDCANAMAQQVGEEGITSGELEDLVERMRKFHAELCSERRGGKLPFMDLPGRRDYVEGVLEYARRQRERFENVVLLGIGGSALGTVALGSALLHPFHNLLPRERRGGPRLFVVDNVDPALMKGLMEVVDPKETLFNVITKSGETAETMSQLMLCVGTLRERLGKEMHEHVVATTDAHQGTMHRIAVSEGLERFEVPEGVGGRFSVLSPVGLLPAAMVGIDVEGLLAGAARMDGRCSAESMEENPAYQAAAAHYLLDHNHGKSVAVMMSYSHALRDVADWFRQLWAESLGKKESLTGETTHVGQTPVKAVGVTDQHSQVQLYMEGPADKMFTFLAVERFEEDVRIPEEFMTEEACEYLGGRTFGELFEAERRGTQIALTEAGRPNATVRLSRVSAHMVGQLLYMLEVQTAMAGKLYGVNAFDQPGVEAGKVAAYRLMGRKGY